MAIVTEYEVILNEDGSYGRRAILVEVNDADLAAAANLAAILAAADLSMSTLQSIIDTPASTFSNLTQAQTAVRALQAQVKDEARILRRLIRLALERFDGTS